MLRGADVTISEWVILNNYWIEIDKLLTSGELSKNSEKYQMIVEEFKTADTMKLEGINRISKQLPKLINLIENNFKFFLTNINKILMKK